MNNKQTVMVIGMVAAVLVFMAAAAFFYSGGGTQRRENLDTTKRFTAKPGTTRENAVALSSDKRPTQQPTGLPKPTGAPPIPVKSLSPPEESSDPETQRLHTVMNSLDPEKGMAMIDADLGLPQRSDYAAQLHAARAQLALQKDPPDYASAAADFARAAELAPSSATRYAYLALDAGALMQQEDYAGAAVRVSQELNEPGPLSPARIRLRAILAQAFELQGELEAAEAAYRKVLQESATYSEEPDPATDDLMRLAALRLSDILRDSGRETEARDLARGLRGRLRGDGEDLEVQRPWETAGTR